MTYRSDHDAALARVAALEAENARLAAALKKQPRRYWTPPAKPTPSRAWLQVLVLIPLVVGMAAGIYALCSGSYAIQISTSPRDEQLYQCGFSLAASSGGGSAMTLERVARTTGCRSEIRNRLDNAVLRFEERRALEHWRDAEDVLATKVSDLTTYYSNHPANGTEASDRLWGEYNDAYDKRQGALTEWLMVR